MGKEEASSRADVRSCELRDGPRVARCAAKCDVCERGASLRRRHHVQIESLGESIEKCVWPHAPLWFAMRTRARRRGAMRSHGFACRVICPLAMRWRRLRNHEEPSRSKPMAAVLHHSVFFRTFFANDYVIFSIPAGTCPIVHNLIVLFAATRLCGSACVRYVVIENFIGAPQHTPSMRRGERT